MSPRGWRPGGRGRCSLRRHLTRPIAAGSRCGQSSTPCRCRRGPEPPPDAAWGELAHAAGKRLPRCRESRYIHSEMRARLILMFLGGTALGATTLIAQEHPVRRVANIVSVAGDEDGKGGGARGVLTAAR